MYQKETRRFVMSAYDSFILYFFHIQNEKYKQKLKGLSRGNSSNQTYSNCNNDNNINTKNYKTHTFLQGK